MRPVRNALTGEKHALWKQGPRGRFQERTGAAGLATPRWSGTGFGTTLVDFNQDGALDLAVVNGRVSRGPSTVPVAENPFWTPYGERHQLFVNDGRGRFKDVSPENPALCGALAIGRALACGDVDGDGAIDRLVTGVAGAARLFRNVVPQRGRWLLVRAIDPALGGRDAYGAEITVAAAAARAAGRGLGGHRGRHSRRGHEGPPARASEPMVGRGLVRVGDAPLRTRFFRAGLGVV